MAKGKKDLLKRKLLKTYPTSETLKKDKIDRNAPCPCGSGKKYKKCCYGGKRSFLETITSKLRKDQ